MGLTRGYVNCKVGCGPGQPGLSHFGINTGHEEKCAGQDKNTRLHGHKRQKGRKWEIPLLAFNKYLVPFDPNRFEGNFQMPATVTQVSAPTGCSHKTITVDLDGEPITIKTDEASASELCQNYKEMLVKAGICRLKAKGLTLTEMAGKGLF
jgi:hypothetical protein